MDTRRRAFIRGSGGLGVLAWLAGAGFLKPAAANTELWNKPAFDAESLEDALNVLVDSSSENNDGISIVAPEIAENGAIVPIGVVATMTGVQSIAILCANNPRPLAAIYEIPDGTLADIKTRVKMAESSDVVVLVKAAGKIYMARKEITVTRGGC